MSNVSNLPSRWDRERKTRDPKDHFVYIIGKLSDERHIVGPVKIGITSNATSRLKGIQTGSAYYLVIVATFAFWKRRHAELVEQCFHRTLEQYRLEGEWFDIYPSDAVALMAMNLRSFIDTYLQPSEMDEFLSACFDIGLPGSQFVLRPEDFRYGA